MASQEERAKEATYMIDFVWASKSRIGAIMVDGRCSVVVERCGSNGAPGETKKVINQLYELLDGYVWATDQSQESVAAIFEAAGHQPPIPRSIFNPMAWVRAWTLKTPEIAAVLMHSDAFTPQIAATLCNYYGMEFPAEQRAVSMAVTLLEVTERAAASKVLTELADGKDTVLPCAVDESLLWAAVDPHTTKYRAHQSDLLFIAAEDYNACCIPKHVMVPLTAYDLGVICSLALPSSQPMSPFPTAAERASVPAPISLVTKLDLPLKSKVADLAERMHAEVTFPRRRTTDQFVKRGSTKWLTSVVFALCGSVYLQEMAAKIQPPPPSDSEMPDTVPNHNSGSPVDRVVLAPDSDVEEDDEIEEVVTKVDVATSPFNVKQPPPSPGEILHALAKKAIQSKVNDGGGGLNMKECWTAGAAAPAVQDPVVLDVQDIVSGTACQKEWRRRVIAEPRNVVVSVCYRTANAPCPRVFKLTDLQPDLTRNEPAFTATDLSRWAPNRPTKQFLCSRVYRIETVSFQ